MSGTRKQQNAHAESRRVPCSNVAFVLRWSCLCAFMSFPWAIWREGRGGGKRYRNEDVLTEWHNRPRFIFAVDLLWQPKQKTLDEFRGSLAISAAYGFLFREVWARWHIMHCLCDRFRKEFFFSFWFFDSFEAIFCAISHGQRDMGECSFYLLDLVGLFRFLTSRVYTWKSNESLAYDLVPNQQFEPKLNATVLILDSTIYYSHNQTIQPSQYLQSTFYPSFPLCFVSPRNWHPPIYYTVFNVYYAHSRISIELAFLSVRVQFKRRIWIHRAFSIELA